MTRKRAEGTSRQSIAVRTRTDLKQRLERAASEQGRSLAQEVEKRLEASFEDQAKVRAAPNPLADMIPLDVVEYLKATKPAADLLSTLASAMKTTNQICRDRGLSELEAREALRAAWGVIEFYHLNMGERALPKLKGPAPALGTKRYDLPARFLGHEVAMNCVQTDMHWKNRAVPDDTVVSRIRDYWSGDGSKLVAGPSEAEVAAEYEAERKASQSALESGEIEFEKPENLRKYVTQWSFEVDEAREPDTSLKDIFEER